MLFALLLVQPALGMIHHAHYQKTSQRTWRASLHSWYGRVLIVVGIIDGGLGLQLAENTMRSENIVYGVVAGVAFAAWVGVAGWWYYAKRRRGVQELGSETASAEEVLTKNA